MAEQMGGQFVLKSRPGEGTTAEIWLPAVKGDTEFETPAPESAAPLGSSGKLKVLAVDDDRLVLFNTTAMLEDLGHDVVEAGSGEEALVLLEKHRFDMLITDQAMPRMTGLQLLEVVRERWPGLPVILATGYAEIPGGTQVTAPKLGKPFTEQALGQALAAARSPAQ
jgi:CheY-like chemotaxis protein